MPGKPPSLRPRLTEEERRRRHVAAVERWLWTFMAIVYACIGAAMLFTFGRWP